jgi:hypothetical protein
MLYINQNQQNEVPATCSRNNIDGGGVYLWEMIHKLTLREYYFIPFRIPPSVTYAPAYDLFCILVDDSLPESLTGNTICGDCNVHLIPGEYWVKIYAQSSSTNLNPTLSDELVYETQGLLVGVNQDIPVSYSGNSDIFILYNEDND